MRLKMPGEMHPNGSTLVLTDPYQGKLLRINGTRKPAIRGGASGSWALVLHDGSFAGNTQRVITAVSGLLLTLLGARAFTSGWHAAENRPRHAPPRSLSALPDHNHALTGAICQESRDQKIGPCRKLQGPGIRK
jgi:uncharacterized iron-regulated membrane protein